MTPHAAVPSGEFVMAGPELCAVCGLVTTNKKMHPTDVRLDYLAALRRSNPSDRLASIIDEQEAAIRAESAPVADPSGDAARLAAVQDALDNHPSPICDVHDDDDAITCGWKRAVIDVQRALNPTKAKDTP